MAKSIVVQEINVSELQTLISETIKHELRNLHQTEPKQSDEIYGTRQDVARKLHISLPTLNEYTKNGTLKGYRLAGRVLYKWSEVNESLDRIQSSKYKKGGV